MTARLDELAATMERKWGVDRLPRLVSRPTADKFAAAQARYRDETEGFCTPERRDVLEAMMERAWAALDAEATARGCFPLPPACYSIRCGDSIVEIAHDQTHATALIWWAKNEGRTVAVWTLEEVATVLSLHGIAHRAKEVWPGALVTTAPADTRPGKRRADDLDDVIPFPNPDAEEQAA